MIKRNTEQPGIIFFIPSVITISTIFVLLLVINISPTLEYSNFATAQTINNLKDKNFVLVNTTDISNCTEFYGTSPVESNNNNTNSAEINGANDTSNSTHKSNESVLSATNLSNKTINQICPTLKVAYPYDCSSDENKTTEIMCRVENATEQEDDDGENGNYTFQRDEDVLDNEIFDENGMLIVDTKFNKQYSYHIVDPLNPDKMIGVNLDLGKHTQSHNSKINSPRIEIERENADGTLDMEAAKNQMIVWKGNILGYFKEPEGKYDNETYIEIMFNTGFHSSDEDDQRRGIGVVFDVSHDSNPYIMDFRDDGRYTKITMNEIKALAGPDFIFHSNDNKSKDFYLNDLINTTNVTLKVKTYLTDQNKRVVQAFIDPGTGKEILYWTLKDVSKLRDLEGIKDKQAFLETIQQGSGFTYVRSDNIETRLASLESLIIDPNKQ